MENPSACTTVNCKVCRRAIALKLHVVPKCVNICVNKSNHPIRNPLLLVTEAQTRDSIMKLLGCNITHSFRRSPVLRKNTLPLSFWSVSEESSLEDAATLFIETECSSEILVRFTCYYIPVERSPRSHCCEILKSNILIITTGLKSYRRTAVQIVKRHIAFIWKQTTLTLRISHTKKALIIYFGLLR
jgi:hypothetical protein